MQHRRVIGELLQKSDLSAARNDRDLIVWIHLLVDETRSRALRARARLARLDANRRERKRALATSITLTPAGGSVLLRSFLCCAGLTLAPPASCAASAWLPAVTFSKKDTGCFVPPEHELKLFRLQSVDKAALACRRPSPRSGPTR